MVNEILGHLVYMLLGAAIAAVLMLHYL